MTSSVASGVPLNQAQAPAAGGTPVSVTGKLHNHQYDASLSVGPGVRVKSRVDTVTVQTVQTVQVSRLESPDSMSTMMSQDVP